MPANASRDYSIGFRIYSDGRQVKYTSDLEFFENLSAAIWQARRMGADEIRGPGGATVWRDSCPRKRRSRADGARAWGGVAKFHRRKFYLEIEGYSPGILDADIEAGVRCVLSSPSGDVEGDLFYLLREIRRGAEWSFLTKCADGYAPARLLALPLKEAVKRKRRT